MSNRLISLIIFIVAVIVVAIAYNTITADTYIVPCKEPLTYRVASIDSRFDTDRQTIKTIMSEVEDIWKTALNKDVLEYRPEKGAVNIHLVFNKEQQRTNDERRLSQRIKRLDQQIKTRKKNLKRLKSNYKKRKQNFQESNKTYTMALKSFNAKLAKWKRQRGGIPPNKKNEVKKIKDNLKQIENDLKRKRKNAEMMRKRVNNKADQVNRIVRQQREVIEKYKNRFSESRKFNQGKFIAKKDELRINIYQYRNRAELKTVLAHEAGHAMGLLHVDNPKSIMYEMMGEQDIFNLKLTQEDAAALAKQCNQ